jgi:hypothetical protein
MSSTRLIYDPCYCKLATHDSVSPMNYQFYQGKYENSHRCKTNDGVVNNIAYGKLIALENNLMNINGSASLCPTDKFNPNTANKGIAINPPDVCDIVPTRKQTCATHKMKCEKKNKGKGFCDDISKLCCNKN